MKKEELQNVTEESVDEMTVVSDDEMQELSDGRKRLSMMQDISLIPDLQIVRRSYSIRDKKYWSYRIAGESHGRAVDISIIAGTTYDPVRKKYTKDKGVYEQLDNLFAECKDIRLGIKWSRRRDGDKFVPSYFVTGIDTVDDLFRFSPVQLQQSSDLYSLDELLRRIAKRNDLYIPSIL